MRAKIGADPDAALARFNQHNGMSPEMLAEREAVVSILVKGAGILSRNSTLVVLANELANAIAGEGAEDAILEP